MQATEVLIVFHEFEMKVEDEVKEGKCLFKCIG